MTDQYLNAYKALLDKYNLDNANADAAAPKDQEFQNVQSQNSLGILLNSLMKNQALAGSIGGKPTQDAGVDYTAQSQSDLKALKDRLNQSQLMKQNAMQGLQVGSQNTQNMMGADKFNSDQSQAALQQKLGQQSFDRNALENPVDLAQRKANLELTKQQILMGGKNPSEVDKELTNIMRSKVLKDTADALPDGDSRKISLMQKYNEINNPKPQLSDAEKATDAAFAKDYTDYKLAGGSTQADKAIAALEKAKQNLQTGAASPGGFTSVISKIPGIGEALTPNTTATGELVKSAAAGGAKAQIGGRVTQFEFENILKQAYNPALPAEKNIEKINDALSQLKAKKIANDAAGQYFEKNRTMKGFTGPSFSSSPNNDAPVKVQAPDGSIRLIPSNMVDQAVSAGGKVVQ